MRSNNKAHKAFTIVELLTVMGVIALLIGLLVPALAKVRDYAKGVRQRAQFHSLAVALEMFKNDQGDYPDSSQLNTGANTTTGAQVLAAALVGRDLQGYDTLSTWDAAVDESNAKIYASTGKSSTAQEIADSMARRKGPYLTLENVGAFNIFQLYPSQGSYPVYGTTQDKPDPFITDVFADRPVTLTLTSSSGTQIQRTVKAGTPVLYFKATASNMDLGKKGGKALNLRTYNYNDNEAILSMGRMMNNSPTVSTYAHPMYENIGSPTSSGNIATKFYDTITNPQVSTTDEGVAYRPDSYILMSAGKDGFFGTADDIYNFGE